MNLRFQFNFQKQLILTIVTGDGLSLHSISGLRGPWQSLMAQSECVCVWSTKAKRWMTSRAELMTESLCGRESDRFLPLWLTKQTIISSIAFLPFVDTGTRAKPCLHNSIGAEPTRTKCVTSSGILKLLFIIKAEESCHRPWTSGGVEGEHVIGNCNWIFISWASGQWDWQILMQISLRCCIWEAKPGQDLRSEWGSPGELWQDPYRAEGPLMQVYHYLKVASGR